MEQWAFPEAKTLTFTSGNIHLTFKTAIITGVCRSGKTTFGNLLATSQCVEHAEEPWTALVLPLMVGLKLIDYHVGRDMFVNFVTELCNDMILLRTANFRPNDLSSIWGQKTHEEIFWRLTNLHRRSDVKSFLNKQNPLLLLNLAETMPFAKFFFDALTDVKLIHVVRKGLDVAHGCLLKHWYSDEQLINPVNAIIYRMYDFKGKRWHLPWWVPCGEEERFLSYSEYERCVYYWCQLMEKGIDEIRDMVENERCIVIHYEEFVANPREVYKSASEFLEITPTTLTESAFAKIKKLETSKHGYDGLKISKELSSRIESLYEKLGFCKEDVFTRQL